MIQRPALKEDGCDIGQPHTHNSKPDRWAWPLSRFRLLAQRWPSDPGSTWESSCAPNIKTVIDTEIDLIAISFAVRGSGMELFIDAPDISVCPETGSGIGMTRSPGLNTIRVRLVLL